MRQLCPKLGATTFDTVITASPGSSWFALQTRVGHEQFTNQLLSFKGYQTFLPLYWEARRWSDRVKRLQLPLFPGYLFCRFDLQGGPPIVATPGVIRIVGTGRKPMAVETEEVEAVRELLTRTEEVQPCQPKQGQKVRIHTGPFAGLDGVIVRSKGRSRLVLSVGLLQRAVSAEVDETAVLSTMEPQQERLV